jgi:hypothetical protein
MVPMHRVAFSNEKYRLMTYLEKHDGHLRQYKYFTRPILSYMGVKYVKQEKYLQIRESKRWE